MIRILRDSKTSRLYSVMPTVCKQISSFILFSKLHQQRLFTVPSVEHLLVGGVLFWFLFTMSRYLDRSDDIRNVIFDEDLSEIEDGQSDDDIQVELLDYDSLTDYSSGSGDEYHPDVDWKSGQTALYLRWNDFLH